MNEHLTLAQKAFTSEQAKAAARKVASSRQKKG
jgi:hypothetical protein